MLFKGVIRKKYLQKKQRKKSIVHKEKNSYKPLKFVAVFFTIRILQSFRYNRTVNLRVVFQ